MDMHATTYGHSAGGVVVSKSGQVLVVQQQDGSWSLPKGHVIEGEDLRATAEREIFEESGLSDVKLVKLLGSYSRYTLSNAGVEDTTSMKRITMYLFLTDQEELRPMDTRMQKAKWMNPAEVQYILTHPKDQEFFLSILPEIEALMSTNDHLSDA